MTNADYVAGAAAGLIFVLGVASTAVSLRCALLPRWRGTEARLAELVLGTSTAVVLVQALGIIGMLVRTALVVGAVVVAVGAELLRRSRRPGRAPESLVEPARMTGTRGVFVAGTAVVAVMVQWLTSIQAHAQNGIEGSDALHYHLTFAAHFAQDHSVLHIYRLDSFAASTWYPLNNELLQGAGMVLLGTIGLTLILDVLAAAGVLLAAWVVARPFGVGPQAVVASCLMLAIMGPDYAGGAYNDWAATWPVLAGFALLVAGRRDQDPMHLPIVTLAGLAGGLAIGTKLTALGPGVVLLVLLTVVSAGRRWRVVGLVMAMYLLTGGYWYVRNLAVTGSPLPNAQLGVGPVHLPKISAPAFDGLQQSVLHYAGNWEVVRHWFVPGLHFFLGPVWFLVLSLVAVGLIVPLVTFRKDRLVLGLAASGLSSAAVYLVTPTAAGGVEGSPALFRYNIRYALVALTIGLLLTAFITAETRLATPLLLLLLLALAITLGRRDAWYGGSPSRAALGVGCAALVGLLLQSGRPFRPLVTYPGIALSLLLLTVLAVPVGRHLDRVSYTTGSPRNELFAAVLKDPGRRVGVVGFPLQFPLFGRRLENHVRYLGEAGTAGSFGDFTRCSDFMAEVSRRKITTVIVQPYEYAIPPMPPAKDWLSQDPRVQLVISNSAGDVFRVQPGAGPQSCAP